MAKSGMSKPPTPSSLPGDDKSQMGNDSMQAAAHMSANAVGYNVTGKQSEINGAHGPSGATPASNYN